MALFEFCNLLAKGYLYNYNLYFLSKVKLADDATLPVKYQPPGWTRRYDELKEPFPVNTMYSTVPSHQN